MLFSILAMQKHKKRFRFSNCWSDIVGFHDMVRRNWNKPAYGKPMEILWKKLNRLQPELRKMNRPISDLQMKINEARSNLEKVYSEFGIQLMDKQRIDKVRSITEQLIHWNDMEEKNILHKTKINWLRMGDDNNAFFHAYLKMRGNAKSIQFVQLENGNVMTAQQEIEDEFLRYYRNLMGQANNKITHIDIEAMRNGKQIGIDQRNMLTRQVSETEIEQALKCIGDNKSPGVDGYGALFFKS